MKPNNFAVEIIVHVKQNLSLNEFYDTGSKKKEKRKKRIVSELSFDDGIRNPPRNGGGGKEGRTFRFCINRMHPLYLLIFSWNRYTILIRAFVSVRLAAGKFDLVSRAPVLSQIRPGIWILSAYQNLAITRPPSFACLFTDPATEQTSFNRGENVCPLVFPHPFPTGRGRPRGKYLVALTQVRNNIFSEFSPRFSLTIFQ